MARMFRLLNADEIEARVNICNTKGVSILLYKDARVDQNILDETVGPMNWQKSYSRENANCKVGLWDEAKQQWIWKEDTGTESFTEKEKGLASDSFKRACFSWGIGRELYTAPLIWVPADKVNLEPKQKGSGLTTKDNFEVQSIGYDDKGNVIQLTVVNSKKDVVAFEMGKKSTKKVKPVETPQTVEQADEAGREAIRKQTIGPMRARALEKLLSENGIMVDTVYGLYKVKTLADLSEAQHLNITQNIEKIKDYQNGSEGKTA